MHKIFEVPQILDRIFSHSSKHTNTVAGRVCQLWFTRSIPFIWERVQLNDALRVLSPFKAFFGGFKEPLTPDAWKRFSLYSNNVRFLECFDIKYAALMRAALYRPSSTDLFTWKLTIINWKGNGEQVDCLSPLLTPTLRVLFISLGDMTRTMEADDAKDVVDALCKNIVFRSPLLWTLEIDFVLFTCYHALQISLSLSKLITLLSQLIRISIPIQFMSPESFAILLCLPRLQNISLSSPLKTVGYLDWEELPENKGTICKESEEDVSSPFQSLKKFRIHDGLDDQTFTIATAFSREIRLSCLVHLTCSPWCQSTNQITALMELVHVVCPILQVISMSGKNCPSGRIPWQAIQALLECKHLHSLEVFSSTVDMELDGMVTVATNRTSWEVVVLPSTKPLNYQALVAFAQNCPQLIVLGLTLSNESVFPELEPGVWFSSLIMLDVGNSGMVARAGAGIFLSAICVKHLIIEATGTNKSRWMDVETLVNSISGSAQVRMLKKEIACLQELQGSKRSDQRVVHSVSTQTIEQEVGNSKLPAIKPDSILSLKGSGHLRRLMKLRQEQTGVET